MPIWEVRHAIAGPHPVREIEAESLDYLQDRKIAVLTNDSHTVALIAMEPGMMISRKQG
jgi:hypothetical protein